MLQQRHKVASLTSQPCPAPREKPSESLGSAGSRRAACESRHNSHTSPPPSRTDPVGGAQSQFLDAHAHKFSSGLGTRLQLGPPLTFDPLPHALNCTRAPPLGVTRCTGAPKNPTSRLVPIMLKLFYSFMLK